MAENEKQKSGFWRKFFSPLSNRDNDGFFLPKDEVENLENPFTTFDKGNTTEFGNNSDIKDVNIVSGSSFVSPMANFDQNFKSIADLILQYRNVSYFSYVNDAITEISNEAIIWDDQPDSVVSIQYEDKKEEISEDLRNAISEEFDTILELLNFNEQGTEYFRQWYTDGRIVFQVVLNKKNLKAGIKRIKLMSPLHLIRHFDEKEERYFWIYNDTKLKDKEGQDLVGKIPDELLIFVPSNAYVKDRDERMISVSNLHYALRDVNRLDTLEDHLIIYRLNRAVERRMIYVDTSHLPLGKGEEYLRQVMSTWKSKKTYDDVMGATSIRPKNPSMLEDIFLMRRNGKGTEITTLPAGSALDTLVDLQYFRMRVFNALRVPFSRVNFEDAKANGNKLSPSAAEITAEELKFQRYIQELRKYFSVLFYKILFRQLVYKGIISPEDWPSLKQKIRFVYKTNAMFAEAKRLKNLSDKMTVLNLVKPYIGTFFSDEYVQTKILGRTDNEIEEIRKQLYIENLGASAPPQNAPAQDAGGMPPA